MHPEPIQKLIDLFSKFPTIGPRTAARFVFYLLKLPKEEIKSITDSISELNNVNICPLCFNPFQTEKCPICSNPKRDKSILCIVEKDIDLTAIEKTKKYNGFYFILGGVISAFKKEDIKNLRIKELLKRLQEPQIKEVIIALSPTTEGEATRLYLERTLNPLNKNLTRLGRGLPIGAELEYADNETLSSALEGRK